MKEYVADNEKTELERPELSAKLAELEILKQSLDDAREKEKKTYDQFLRLGADFENYRKRAEARISDARRYGNEEVLLQIVSLYDILAHAVDASEKTEDLKGLKTGLKLVHKEFEKLLKDQGLTSIKAIGRKLDPHQHEAVSQEVSDSVEEGTIVGEIQRGFAMGERVIRTAKVRVAAKPNAKDDKSPNQKEN